MNMKTITTFLTCLLLLFSAVSLSADNEKPTQQTTPIIIAVLTPGTVHGRSLSDMPPQFFLLDKMTINEMLTYIDCNIVNELR